MKIKKRYLYYGIFAVIVLAISFFYFKPLKESGKDIAAQSSQALWLVDENGYLSYPLDRGPVNFSRTDYSETDRLFISRIVFQSRNGNIYGLLVIPKSVSSGSLPGVVLLPGAGVSKESELSLAENISELGIAVLTIDQRGVGETDGIFPSLDEDYTSFLKSEEPYQHLMVYDALRAFDLLQSARFIDPDRIVIAGESLGGRIAVTASAIDRHVKGVLVISWAGIDLVNGPDKNKNAFLNSINSDHYIGLITPRKLVMIHSINDTMIPASSAAQSFMKAQEPKQFYLINDTSCRHGYCDAMYPALAQGLQYLMK